VSGYGRTRPRRATHIGRGPADHNTHRRLRRALRDASTGGKAFGLASEPELLLDTFRRMRVEGGRAPGPDGVTYDSLSLGEAADCLREAAKAIRRGDYRPGPSRQVSIPKLSGGTRTLTVFNLIDRVVAAAVAHALTPATKAAFLPCSYGFRPGLGVQDLLADLLAAMAARRIHVLAIDDVRKAFDRVPIAPLMEAFTGYTDDPRLLRLVEAILRGGPDRDRTLGIPQGCPLSPLALNVFMHEHHDVPLRAIAGSPSPYRYADNLAYLCRDVPEGDQALDRVRRLLTPAGLALKGQDGPPVDLEAGGEASLLGFRLAMEGGRVRAGLLEQALAVRLLECHDEHDPPRSAVAAVMGWIESMGPALGGPTEATLRAIILTAARHGFRELAPMGELADRCRAAHGRWRVRLKAALLRHGVSGGFDHCAAAPPAAIFSGVSTGE